MLLLHDYACNNALFSIIIAAVAVASYTTGLEHLWPPNTCDLKHLWPPTPVASYTCGGGCGLASWRLSNFLASGSVKMEMAAMIMAQPHTQNEPASITTPRACPS